MSAAEHRTVARLPSAAARPRIRQAVARALNWLDGNNNPYSPAVCVSALLLVGLTVKLGPGLHAFLAHN